MSVYKRYTDYIKCIINDDFSNLTFKSNPNFCYMLEHVTEEQGNNFLFQIKNKFNLIYNENINYLIDLVKTNDLYGSPNKYTFINFTTCSPTNLRYIYHSFLILEYMNECNITNIDVIEIGGGYGGLCFFINKLSCLFNININTYTIFDLTEPLILQQKYLTQLELDINKFNFFEINNCRDIKKNSFLISTYAFSEISLDIQKEYTTKILNPYVSYGFIVWNIIDVYKFIDDKIIITEKEYPMTDETNKYVKFKPLLE